jgi:Family of unknown function (DUF5906)
MPHDPDNMPDDEDEAHEKDLQTEADIISLPGRDQKDQKAYSRPQISSIKDVVDWMNQYYWKITLPGKVKFLSKRVPNKIIFLDKKGIMEDTENLKLTIESAENGKRTRLPWSKVWLESLDRNELDDVIFHPDLKYVQQHRIFNFWEGYKLVPKEGDVTPFKDVMKDIICSGHRQHSIYLAALISQMFQFPHLKPGVAVVIRGEEGIGKSWFVEKLCDLMKGYYFKTPNPNNVFGDHNGQLQHVILLHLEEAVWAGSKKDESLLKDLITGRTIEINEKFQPIISVANHLHLFITGNPDWLVSAGFKARRLFALHASEAHIKDTKYFARLDDWLYNQGGAAALLHYFLTFDIKAALDELQINDLRLVPVTDELLFQKRQGLTGVAEWLDNLIETHEMPYGALVGDEENYELDGVPGTRVVNARIRVIKKALYYNYCKSQERRRTRVILTERMFGIKLLELLPLVVDGKVQKHDNGHTKSIIDPNVKAPDNNKHRRDGYDIPRWSSVRDSFNFTLGIKESSGEGNEWDIRELFYPREMDHY